MHFNVSLGQWKQLQYKSIILEQTNQKQLKISKKMRNRQNYKIYNIQHITTPYNDKDIC